MFGQHGGVEDGVFLVGEGVVVGAHLVELAVHLVGRAAGRALEDHVFEEMAHAGQRVVFIAGAGVDEEPQRRGIGRVVALGDDFQAVGKGVFEKFHLSPLCPGAIFWPANGAAYQNQRRWQSRGAAL